MKKRKCIMKNMETGAEDKNQQTAKDLNDRRRYYWSLPVFDVLQPLQSLRWKLYCLFRKKSEFLRK